MAESQLSELQNMRVLLEEARGLSRNLAYHRRARLEARIGEAFEKEMPSSKSSTPSARAFPRSIATSPRLARGDPSSRTSAPAQDRSWTKALGTCWRRTSKSDHRCVAARLLHKVSRRTAIPLPLLHILPAN